MKVYVDENDIKRNIITYCNGTNTQQGLYVFGKDKIEVQSLADYTKQVCEKIKKNIVKYVYGGNLFDIKGFKELLDQIEKGDNL